jgi:hypothetical protein
MQLGSHRKRLWRCGFDLSMLKAGTFMLAVLDFGAK